MKDAQCDRLFAPTSLLAHHLVSGRALSLGPFFMDGRQVISIDRGFTAQRKYGSDAQNAPAVLQRDASHRTQHTDLAGLVAGCVSAW